MGIVYLGRDPVIGRLVALKTILAIGEDETEQREFGERFLREAQAAGILSHPNIVTIHDVGEDPSSQTAFIAMEFVEGKNLKQLLQEKTPFGWERVAEIIGQAAEALDYAHRRGIVHRDVKPANIIITPEGGVKITDFGIAKIEQSNLTTEGQFLGTPNYMSPEQVTGDAVDGRTDLFSLGVVLYELLTRKKPFTGDNLTSISFKIVHEPFVPPEIYASSVPSEFTPILQKGLAKDPAERYQRGNDLALALYEFKAREEERQMLRDLGNMVAEAENLGGIEAVNGPTKQFPAPDEAAPAVDPARPSPGASEPLMTVPIVPIASRTVVNPGPGAPAPPQEGSAPDWTLDEPEPDTKTPPGPLVAAPVKAPKPEDEVRPTVILPPSSTGSRPFPPPQVPLESRPTEVILDAAKLASLGGPPARLTPPIPVARPAPPPSTVPAPAPPSKPPSVLPVPALPPELTEPLPPLPPAPPPPTPRTGAPKKKKGGPSRFVVAVVGGTLVIAAAVLGVVWARKALNERSLQTIEEAKAKEVAERADLMAEGNRLVGAGTFAEGLEKYREVVRREPTSAAARDAVAKTELLLAEKEMAAGKAKEVEAHLSAAREADRAADDLKVIEEAEAALAVETANAEARSLRAAAHARIASRGAAEQKRMAEALKKKAKPAQAPVQASAAPSIGQRTARETAAPVPTPATGKVVISFASPIPEGHVMVSFNDKFIFRKSFAFGKKSGGGQVDGSAEIPSGRGTFKVWVIAPDRSINQYKEFPASVPGGDTKTLRLDLDAGGNLSVSLK